MPLQEFTRDVVPIIQLILGTLGLASLSLLWWQVRQTNLWNKLNSPQNFAAATSVETERRVDASLKKLGIDPGSLNRSITQDELTRIKADEEAYFAIKTYLNEFENLGAAISIGAADLDLAYAVHSTRLIQAHMIFAPFIDALREKQRNHEIYIEVEKLALAWRGKQQFRQKAQERRIRELMENLTKESGAAPKV